MNQDVTPLLPAAEVKKYLHRRRVVIADVRGGADAFDRFKEGHLEGALFLDLERELSEKNPDPAYGGRHPLPDPRAFGNLLGTKGIEPSSHILIYDDKSGANAAARFWWMMRAAGHSKVQVIDGGYAALVEEGLPVARGEATPFPTAPPYPLTAWQLPVADIATVDSARADNDFLVIDVRENYRYKGESEPIDLVAGHIPGAVNAPYLDNLQANGKFRPAQELASMYHALTGRRHPRNLIVHCGSGVTACHTLLAMEVAGIKGATLYPGSWSEWSRRGKPIAREG